MNISNYNIFKKFYRRFYIIINFYTLPELLGCFSEKKKKPRRIMILYRILTNMEISFTILFNFLPSRIQN